MGHQLLGGQSSISPLSTVVLSCILLMVTSALITASCILGSKIAKLEHTVPYLGTPSGGGSTSNDTSNTNNPSSSASSPSPSNNNSNNYNNYTPQPSSTTSGSNTAATQPPTPPTLLVSGWTYLGCFYDSTVRVLPDGFLSAVNMTNAVCADWCDSGAAGSARKPRHFGTQVSLQCYCGTASPSVLASRRAPDWECMHQCYGRPDMSEACGGDWTLSLWERDE